MGVIIEDFKDCEGLWRKSRYCGDVCHYTVSGSRWNAMVSRCRPGGAHQRKSPTHGGVSVSAFFMDFQFFTEWHKTQTGYGIGGYHLDKDILVPGNRVYDASTCVLIPKQLNSFLVLRNMLRGEHPLGVHLSKAAGTYGAFVSRGGKLRYVGSFLTAAEAHEAYAKAKEAEAYRWYERLKAGEFIVDERVIERMRTWTLEGDIQ